MKMYKLTDKHHQTKNATQWGEGVTHKTTGDGDLCGPGWLHCYADPLLAAFMHPAHIDYDELVLWECKAEGERLDDGELKSGFTKITTLQIIPLPAITTEQRVEIAIRVAMIKNDKAFTDWAENWLSGKDRSARSAASAAWSARWSAWSAASAAAWSARWLAASAKESAWWAAASAVRSAAEVAAAKGKIDLLKIIRQVTKL